MANDKPELSIIIPIYQGVALVKENLPILNEFLSHLAIRSQILVVDDGSENPRACRKVAEANRAVYLSNPSNLGKGAAVRRGMLAASGQVRIFTDADLPYNLKAIPQAYTLLRNGGVDVIVGDRTLSSSHYFDLIPKSRKVSSRIFTLIARIMLLNDTYDTQCGFKGFTALAANDIFARTRIDRFAMDVEVMVLAGLIGYSISRMDVQLRNWQSSGISIFKDGFTMLIDLLRIRYFLTVGAYARS